MRDKSIILMAVITQLLLPSIVNARGETCIDCHLHSGMTHAITNPEGKSRAKSKTLADFHIRVFSGTNDEIHTTKGCQQCHENRHPLGLLPVKEICLGCHTKGKTTVGDPSIAFHAARDHWPIAKIDCVECHLAHRPGNQQIKFLTPDVITVCQGCHKNSFALDQAAGVTDSPTVFNDESF